jgi:hypothetical protein
MDDGRSLAKSTEQTPSDDNEPQSQVTADSQFESEELGRRWELLTEYIRQARADMQSSSDSYDESLLKLSGGALALSLAFIKDIVPLKDAHYMWMLFVSWLAFAICILCVIASYRLSADVQEPSIEDARKMYFGADGDESPHDLAKNKRLGRKRKALTFCNNFSGASFVAGFLLTILFVIINVLQVVRK